MALTCIPQILTSTIWGCFWERDVECNFASEWLGPLLLECIPYLLKAEQHHTIIRMMAERRPNTATLWLGMWITGFLPRLFQLVGQDRMPISLEAAHWTSSPQSFMDPAFHGLPQVKKEADGRIFIRREDEYRLLYIKNTTSLNYAVPPMCPWAPFGWVGIDTCATEVRGHLRCGDRPVYQRWTWIGRDGKERQDYGLPGPSTSLLMRVLQSSRSLVESFYRIFRRRCIAQFDELDDDVIHAAGSSRMATKNIFIWPLAEGTKPEDEEYWKHEWIEWLLDPSDDDES